MELDIWLRGVLVWLAEAPPDAAVEQKARLLLLDTLGCAIAGMAEPEVRALARHISDADPGALRLPGLEHGLTADGMARVFAAASCWHEACEGLASAHGRPGLHALPAVLGPALRRGASLGAVLDALVAGCEIGGRLGAICRIRPGMHVDGTWGSFAAVAAYARLLGLGVDATMGALDHAACHMPFSLYRPITLGSTARNAYVGHGAVHGVASVLASLAGMEGPPGSLQAMAGLALGIAPDALPAAAPAGAWLLPQGYLKKYPAVKHVHYGAAAAEAFHAEAPFPAAAIDDIALHIYEEAQVYCANRAPRTAIQAQFSLTYGAAWSLLHGTLVPRAYAATAFADPDVARLESLLRVVPEASLGKDGARACILRISAGAQRWERRIDTVLGDPQHPMSRADVLAKFTAYAAPVIGDPAAVTLAAHALDGGRDEIFRLGA